MFKRKNIKKDRLIIIFCLVIGLVFLNITFFANKLSPGIINISKLKVNEITTNILNDAVLNYKKENKLNNLIVTKTNDKDEIIYVDVLTEEAYLIMEDLVEEIRNNIKKFQETDYNYYNMESISFYKDNLVIALPLGATTGKNLIINLGPKIPVKMSLLENVKANVKVDLKEYGINNSLINVYIKFNIEQNIEMPSCSKSFYNNYEMLLSSKLVHGTVPEFLSGFKNKESEIVNVPVN